MIRAGSGLSKGEDAHDAGLAAARAAAASVEKPRVAFVFASGYEGPDVGEVLEGAREALRGATVVGCSAGGVIGEGEEVEGEAAVSVLAIEAEPDSVAIEPFLVPLAGEGARDADALAARLAGKARGLAERSALLLFPDPFAFDGKPFLARVREKLGKLPVMGALAAGPPSEDEGLPVFAGAERSRRAVSGALLSGPGFRATVAVAQGCRPVGEPAVVTRSERNVIFELDGEPALARLKTAVETARAGAGQLLCGLALDSLGNPLASDDYLARNLAGVDPKSGAVAVAELVPPGSRACFLVRDAQAAREDLGARVRELAAGFREKPPAFGLYFDCVGRGAGFYGEAGVDVGIIREALGDFPLAGFFGNGELAPFLGTNLVHNYTGVLLLVSA